MFDLKDNDNITYNKDLTEKTVEYVKNVYRL